MLDGTAKSWLYPRPFGVNVVYSFTVQQFRAVVQFGQSPRQAYWFPGCRPKLRSATDPDVSLSTTHRTGGRLP